MEKIAKALLVAAALAVLSSIFFPYWHLTIKAPQYPKGLKVTIYLNAAKGDVGEIDNLNHYIGMRSLTKAALLERKVALPGMLLTALCLLGAAFIPRKWASLLIIPAVTLPAFFAADLYYWMRDFGLHLDPHAPLSSSVKPFVPPLLGQGKIAQFHASANFAFGHGLAMLSALSALAAVGLRFVKIKRHIPGTAIGLALIFLAAGDSSAARAQTLVVQPTAQLTLQSVVDRAADGDTVLVKPGVYAGPLVVQKSLRLVGEGFPVIDGGGKGTVIRLNAPDTVFQGFVVRNSGDLLSPEDTGLVVSGKRSRVENNRFENVLFGLYVHQAAGAVVRNNFFQGKALDIARRGDLIRVWYSNDVTIEANHTVGGRDAVLWFSKNMTVRDNEFRGGRYGLHFMYCKDALVQGNRMANNSVGVYLMYSSGLKLQENIITENRGPSGFGIGFKDMDGAIIQNNIVSANRVGLFLENALRGRCEGNLITCNDIGMQISPSARENRFEKNDFIDNTEQILLEGQSVYTVNNWNGNYWSDYRGYDANADGIGDVPHKPMKLFELLTDRTHAFKIFFASPVMHAIDFAAAAFPVFAPVPKFTDNVPLMQPVPIPVKAQAATAPGTWALFSSLLLLPLAGFLKPHVIAMSSESLPLAPVSSNVPAISARDLTKRFKKVTALDGVDVEIRRGEVVALWGPNGAGKTTLLRCLLGILHFEGQAQVMGLDVRKNGKEVRRHIGYVPQEIRLHLDQTVWETVCFYARLRRVSKDTARKLLCEWGLDTAQKQLAQNLSGGMKQKLSLVIALLSDPPILFLDEPMSNLDVATRVEFENSLERLKTAGKMLLFCSHRYAEVRKIADRVILLEAGRKKIDGKPDAVRESLSGKTLLRLSLNNGNCQRALECLTRQGMAVTRRGNELWVEVASDRKAEPIQLLAQASIPVLDFDAETEFGGVR